MTKQHSHARTRRAMQLAGAALLAGTVSMPVAAQDKDTLRLAIWSLVPTFGNTYSGTARPHVYLYNAMFDSVTQLDAKGAVTPMLAASWELVDATTWRFKIRPNVKFQNGEAMNAAAIKASLDYLRSDEGKRFQLATELNQVVDATVVDELTVDVKSNAPNAMLPHQMAGLRPPAPKYWAEAGLANAIKQPYGTGPFKVISWTDQTIRMEAFEGAAVRQPQVKKFEITAVPESPARVGALLSGQVDIALRPDHDDVPRIKQAGHNIVASPGTGVRGMVLRALDDGSPFRDKRVRQAVNYASNKAAINDALFSGSSKLAGQPALEGTFGHNPNIRPYAFDQAKAKQLLTEAGFPNGFKAKAEILNTGASYISAYQLISADLKKVGIDLELQQITIPDLLGKLTKQRPFDGVAFDFDFETLPSADALRLKTWHSCFNRMSTWYCFPETQAKIEAALNEPSVDKRRQMTQELMQIYHDDPPVIYLLAESDIDGVSKRVEGYEVIQRHVQYHKIKLKN